MNRIGLTLALFLSLAFDGYGQKAPELPTDTLASVIGLELPSVVQEVRLLPGGEKLKPETVALGRRIFFDPLLSKNKTVSCASCHRPEFAFASPEKLAIGIDGKLGTRNTPTLFNRSFGGPSFWDGRVETLEEQVIEPISNPIELGHSLKAVLATLRADRSYAGQFAAAFPGKADQAVSEANLAHALASFVRALVLADSPVDRFHAGESKALNAVEKRGLWIFESKGGCWQCHTGFNFTDEDFHNTGVSWNQPEKDPGRGKITGNSEHARAFKTPTLRGVARTAPYMHDGSQATLADVVEFYDRGGERKDPQLDKRLKPLNLDDADKKALVAFLEALSRNQVNTARQPEESRQLGTEK